MAMTPEGRIKKKMDAMLKSKKKLWWFKPQSGPFGRSGVPDYIICANGWFIGIEAKANKTKKPTTLQWQCMNKIELAQGLTFIVYDDETIAAVSAHIQGLLKLDI